MRCFLLILGIVACAATFVKANLPLGYHDRIGIPEAARIKAEEDELVVHRADAGRVAGGFPAAVNAHPYFAGLLISFWNSGSDSLCGASLLSANRLVTAAHCWYDGTYRGLRLTAVLGTNFLFYGGFRVSTAMVTMHPFWNPSLVSFGAFANNIAMITLPVNVAFTDSIQPINLPTGSQLSDQFIFEWAIAAGYGKTNDQQTSITTGSVLNQVNLQIVPVTACQQAFSPHLVTLHAICTSGILGTGLCPGDYGGPLVINRDEGRVLIGIGSFGASTGCQQGFPTVYTNVSTVLPFIREHLS